MGMKTIRKLKLLFGCFATGAALSYLLDPVSGRRRRKRAVDTIRRRSDDVRDLADAVSTASDALSGSGPEPEPTDTPPVVAGVTDVAASGGEDLNAYEVENSDEEDREAAGPASVPSLGATIG
jgi:hypothetical protein